MSDSKEEYSSAAISPGGRAFVQRHKRCSVSLRVQYRSFDDFRVNYTKNVSSGGMFLLTKVAYSIGDTINLLLFVPDFLDPIKIVGEVIHRQYDENDDSKTGIGIKFIEIDEESRDTLVNYLSILGSCQ